MRKLFVPFVAVMIGFFMLVPVASTSAQALYVGTASSDKACDALKDLNPDNKGCGAAEGGVDRIIRLALNLLSIVAGVIGVIMVIVSGFKYITAQGDANQISSAKRSLIYAIAGLVVVAFAQAIVQFVLKKSINA